MGESNLYSIHDGGTLRILENGLEIVRRQKHEWLPALTAMPHDRLEQRTGKVWGSKFYPEWTLPVLVDWVAAVVTKEGWVLQPGEPMEVDRLLDRTVGLAMGTPTRKI